MVALAKLGMGRGRDSRHLTRPVIDLYYCHMRSNARGWASVLVSGLLALAGCGESTSPGSLTLTVTPATRSYGVNQDSVVVAVDSVAVGLTGAGASAARWSATQGGAEWLTLVTPSGTGSGALRWVVYPVNLGPGTYVDTVTVVVQGAKGSPAVLLDSVTIRGTQAALITVRRAWLPGERDAAIAAFQANHTTVPYVGDLSDLAPSLFDPDSVTLIVPNPLYPAPRSGQALSPAFAAGWGAIGVDIFVQGKTSTPWDTLSWLGVMWWNPADTTWKGWTIRATTANTYNLYNVSTSAFDASYGTTGAGGGEAQQSTGTYWEASSGRIQINYNNACGTTTTITSGVWTGGTTRRCTFGGRLVSLTMPRQTGTTAPATQTINFDFRSARISGSRITCVFPTPCTGVGVAAAIARLHASRAASAQRAPQGQP
jgi:hypothetical protein